MDRPVPTCGVPRGPPVTGLQSLREGGGIVVTAGCQMRATADLESRGHVTAPCLSENSSAGQRKPSLTTAPERERDLGTS